MRSSSEISISILTLLLIGASLLCCGCKESKTKHRDSKSIEIWRKAEWQDRTNEPVKAYPLLLSARDELIFREAHFPKEANYDFCLAILDARLFVLAGALGKTNETVKFMQESAERFNARLRKSGIAESNFSAEAILK